MALFTISDLHLPLGVDKPMDIFGSRWENYVEKLYNNWQANVKKDDMVVLPGDFSWAMYLDDAKKDFEFLQGLNGKKILLKGNHDYWWDTMSRMGKYTAQNGYDSVFFLNNNHYQYKNIAICGTRGWTLGNEANKSTEDKKIYLRELQRLEMSLKSASEDLEKIVFMHYPPIAPGYMENGFTEIFAKYNVRRCVYGHLHAKSSQNAIVDPYNGVEYLLVSCDYLNFMPVKLSD